MLKPQGPWTFLEVSSFFVLTSPLPHIQAEWPFHFHLHCSFLELQIRWDF